MDNIIKNYKEILVNKSGKNQTYFFSWSDQDLEKYAVQGYYIIDEFGQKWLSIDATSSIFYEKDYEQFKSKYFDINRDKQKLFYNIDSMNINEFARDHLIGVLKIIQSNVRQGSPRKYLQLTNGEKVNIEMPFETVSKYEF